MMKHELFRLFKRAQVVLSANVLHRVRHRLPYGLIVAQLFESTFQSCTEMTTKLVFRIDILEHFKTVPLKMMHQHGMILGTTLTLSTCNLSDLSLFRDDDSDANILKRVTVEEHLGDDW